jgi:hypothetical protein
MKKITFFTALGAVIVLGGCFYDLPTSGRALRWNLINKTTDTVSVFTSFTFVFSEPIVDSGVGVAFIPSFSDFSTKLNSTRDTFTIITAGQLRGSTRYVLRRTSECRTAHNRTLYPEDDSTVFITHASEQEPNNSFLQADSLVNTIDGVIALVNDTDIFVLSGRPAGFVLEGLDSRVTLFILDSAGVYFAPAFGMDESALLDTIALPDTLRAPLSCAVYSPYRVSGSRYILSALAP